MKKAIFLSGLVIILTNNCFGQESHAANAPMTRADYLSKSKTQKICAFVLLGAGIVAIASVSSGNSTFNTTETVGIIGGAAILGSIPLFLASSHNKRKSRTATVFFNIQKIGTNPIVFAKPNYVPALSVRLKF